jgi:hypothetical protein
VFSRAAQDSAPTLLPHASMDGRRVLNTGFRFLGVTCRLLLLYVTHILQYRNDTQRLHSLASRSIEARRSASACCVRLGIDLYSPDRSLAHIRDLIARLPDEAAALTKTFKSEGMHSIELGKLIGLLADRCKKLGNAYGSEAMSGESRLLARWELSLSGVKWSRRMPVIPEHARPRGEIRTHYDVRILIKSCVSECTHCVHETL